MAGERKGITYEAIVMIALDELAKKGELPGRVFWNEKPDGMTIEPDLTAGPDKDHPTHVFLVTHSGAAGNSHMKFWRNIGELVECKVRLPRPARTYSLVFDSVIKEDLKALQSAAFDGQVILGDTAKGRLLQQWVDRHQASLPKDKFDKVNAIRKAMRDRSATDCPRPLINDLVARLRRLVRTERTSLDTLWSMERARPIGVVPTARDTFLRRGVGKLLLLEHADDVEPSGQLKPSVPPAHVEALKTMGIATESISGPRVVDPQMLWAVRHLPTNTLAQLHEARSLDRVEEWVDTLLGLPSVSDQLQYLAKHWGDLTTGPGLFRHLQTCHRNPHKLCPAAAPPNSKRVWLFHLVVEWIKLAGGSRTAFGLAVLVNDLDTLKSDPVHRATVEAILGRQPTWLAKHTLGLGLTDWHSAASRQTFAFSDDDLARVADVLARRLAECSRPEPKKDAPRLTEALVQTVLEAKLLTYRNFKPFEGLLGEALAGAGLKGVILPALRSCFAEAASSAGATLDPRSSGTTVMRVNSTFINWQSASDQGRDHKKKELCGRAPALRYSWDASANAFTRRPGVDKLILIVDGTWRQEDLDALVNAGWDEIFYPDEMDELVKAIV